MESNTEVTIRFNSKFRIFTLHYFIKLMLAYLLPDSKITVCKHVGMADSFMPSNVEKRN